MRSLLTIVFVYVVGCTRAYIPNDVPESSVESGSLTALKYTNVGGSGTYNQVTNMVQGSWPSCTANPSCITRPKAVGGNLAPFDEEMTFVFRGSLRLHRIAVYQPRDPSSANWERVSSWSQGTKPENLVFMNNKGGGKSGEWDTCGGSSQSYANGDWTDAATAPNAEMYTGILQAGQEINIVTSVECKRVPCDGFSRGTASHGWAGSKLLVVDFEMPNDNGGSVPAIWALNSQVTNAAQYGCNCRGMGGNGGCGELDILETLSSNTNQGITEIYSFKGATGCGDGSFFPRPTSGVVTYIVIFDVETDSIAIQRLSGWDYSQTTVPRSTIVSHLDLPSKIVSFALVNRRSRRRSNVPT
ncbi:hypothetical protein K474DRAFT_1600845 [Panus rudis PR-1116 ss-1]|nr:hypothetical protein K474DRAFT_1600845 [Panus rudis PR-1116 ss-1]